MIEAGATLIITMSSISLFVYWFRYTCLLILSAKTTTDYAAEIATANQLSFLQVQASLREGGLQDLDSLTQALDRDYAVIRHLLDRAANGESHLETRMLQVNYRMMHTWYSISRTFSPTAARKALNEMAMTISHFANAMGEQAASAA